MIKSNFYGTLHDKGNRHIFVLMAELINARILLFTAQKVGENSDESQPSA